MFWDLEFLAPFITLQFVVTGAQSSSCYIFGTEHVYTFDGQAIDFSTDLELLAAQTCPPSVAVPAQFSISIINEYKYTNIDSASQVKCVKVIYKSFVTRMCADQSATVSIASMLKHSTYLSPFYVVGIKLPVCRSFQSIMSNRAEESLTMFSVGPTCVSLYVMLS